MKRVKGRGMYLLVEFAGDAAALGGLFIGGAAEALVELAEQGVLEGAVGGVHDLLHELVLGVGVDGARRRGWRGHRLLLHDGGVDDGGGLLGFERRRSRRSLRDAILAASDSRAGLGEELVAGLFAVLEVAVGDSLAAGDVKGVGLASRRIAIGAGHGLRETLVAEALGFLLVGGLVALFAFGVGVDEALAEVFHHGGVEGVAEDLVAVGPGVEELFAVGGERDVLEFEDVGGDDAAFGVDLLARVAGLGEAGAGDFHAFLERLAHVSGIFGEVEVVVVKVHGSVHGRCC